MGNTNFTTETVTHLILDVAKVVKNYTTVTPVELWCTRGGSEFTIEQDIKKMEFDGIHGDVKGDKRIIGKKATMKINFIEHSKDIIMVMLPGSSSAAFPVAPATKTHDRITRSGDITDADYWTDITLLAQISGSATPVVISLMNPLASGNFSLNFSDKEEAGCTLEMTGHADPASPGTEPWRIDFPVIA
jgi:hypothetical protein